MAVIEITQADRDRNRRKNHFQVRLDDDLANKLRHFMQSRDYNANQALSTIISRFFKNA
jgi:predicted transcriptional regulator